MTYTFKQNLVASNKYSIKCPYEMKPEYVTLHDTANQASAENEIAYMIRNDLEVSFHIAVDEKEAIQGLPLNRNSWSCGDKVSGNGNRKGISVEICRPTHEDRTLYNQAEENAVYVAARLLYKYGLGIDRLKKHQDWSGKKCPNVILTENRWEGIKGRVQWVLDEIKKGNIDSALESGTTSLKSDSNTTSNPTPSSTATVNSNCKVGDKVKVKTTATHYATGQSIKSFVKGSTYEVTKVDGNKLLLSDIVSWVWDYDVERIGSTTTTTAVSTNSFLVEIICDSLNIRQKADFNSKVVGTVKKGDVLTIIGEENGLGKLKSGAGYISLNSKYVKRK